MLKHVALLALLLPLSAPMHAANTPAQDEAEIRAARVFSNQSIKRRNLLGVGDSLAENFVAVIGDGSFVPSRAEYLKLFQQDFNSPKTSLRYERITDTVQVSTSKPLAAEQGHWIGTDANGNIVYTGTYMAMWEHGKDGWKIRSELYVNLAHH
jgi:ketosteroid isomerase-like protein